ncbi:MAG: lipase secretion chaperone [Luteimonas sp.]
MSLSRQGAAILATIVLIAMAVGAWLMPRSTSHQAASPVSAAVRSSAPPATQGIPRSNALPASLRGTTPDGGVRFDANGQLVTDAELRRLFDWYLAALGEQDIGTIHTRLQRDLALRMTPARAAAVLAWFDRYAAYLRASTRLADISDLRARLDAVHALRVRLLGRDAADGFFGEEETEARRVLALKQMHADPAQRAVLQQSLDAASPGYAQARHDAALRVQISALDTQFARDGASATERHAERSALLGAAAAERFETLDRQRAQWNDRAQTYARQRAALQRRSNLTDAQRVALSRQLLASFTPAEQRRIAALTEAGALR